MNCREFTIEFEDRGTLSETARLHLTVCTDCRKASERQTQVWLMIDTLKPVAAPNDFDFHVKARIAQAKPSDFRKPAFLPVLRYVLPLSVAVLLLGVFVFNSTYFSTAPTNNSFAQTETQTPATTKNELPRNIALNETTAFAPATNESSEKMVIAPPPTDEKIFAGTSPSKDAKPGRKEPVEVAESSNNRTLNSLGNSEENEPVGSRVLAVNSAVILYPKNLTPNQQNQPSSSGFEAGRPIGDEGTLDFFGIRTITESGKRTVKSLDRGKQGERSGVRIGDIIERVNQSTLTIRRGTETLEITLR